MLKKQFVSVAAVAVLTTGVAFAAVQQDKVMYKQADGTYVVNTTSLCSNVKGFKGATPVEVYIKNNKVIKVEALPNREGPKFYDKVKQGLFPKFVFSLFHKSATKDSANPPLTNVLTDSISQIGRIQRANALHRKVIKSFRKNTQKEYKNLIFLLVED
ncbi:FMN-binding protein [Prevotella melaninogenica]